MIQTLKEVLAGQEENYLLPFFWQHDGHKEELTERIQKIYESGCRAFCLESRPFEDFCGATWWENMEIILREAKRLGMKVWILDDKHFPTGYANGLVKEKYPERRRWYVRELHVDLMGPAKDVSVLIPPCGTEEKLISVCAFRRTGEGEALTGEPLVLMPKAGEKFLWLDVPEGCWRVFFLYQIRNTTSEDANARMNMLTPEGVQTLIEAVYEPHYEHFKEYFGNTIAGFFSDEPSLDSPYVGPWGKDSGFYYRTVGQPGVALPWDELVLFEMEKNGGSDIGEWLPALWYPMEEKSQEIRLNYMDSVTKLWKKNFSQQLGNWCREHGVMYIGHIIEDMNAHARLGCSAGHFFRALEGQDMSGIDIVLHQVMPGMGEYQTAAAISEGIADPEFFHYMLAQLAASQARQVPHMKGRVMCEVFGAFGWAEGAPFMNWLMDFLLVRGVNHFVPHAFTDFFPDPDCPPHFGGDGNDPQLPGFTKLMGYTNRAAHLLYGAEMEAAGAIFYHAEAEWMESDGCMMSQKPAKACYDRQIPYDVVSLDFLEQAQAQNGVFGANARRYRFLIVPSCHALPERFWKNVRRLQDAGVEALFVAPAFSGEEIALESLAQRLLDAGLAHDYRTKSPLLRIARFDRDGATMFFLHNESHCCVEEALQFPVSGKYLELDLLNEVYKRGETSDGQVELVLEPGESRVLLWGSLEDAEWEQFPVRKSWKPVLELENCWDIAWMEQGKSEEFQALRSQTKLFNVTGRDGNPEFSGQIRYGTTFVWEKDRAAALDLGEVGEIAHVILNGKDLGWRISAPYRWEISEALKQGVNELEIVVANTLANRMQDDLSRFMTIPASGLIGPVRVMEAADSLERL